MTERRIYPRIKASHSALYFTRVCPRPRVASTVDLSMGGTRIETSYGLVTGQRLEITIAIRPQAITCRGKTVYVLGPENGSAKAGIKFEELSEYDRLYLREYLSHAMKERA